MGEAAKNRTERFFRGFRSYLWLFAGIVLCFYVFSPFIEMTGDSGSMMSIFTPYDGDVRVRTVMAILIFALLLISAVLKSRRKLSSERIILLLILGGLVMRVGYMLYTPFYVRGHDVLNVSRYGHLSYLFRLYEFQQLPGSYLGQYYHPPLAHILGALSAKLYSLITGAEAVDTVFQAVKLVPCFASCALLIVCRRLFHELNINGSAAVTGMAVISFHPTFYLLSASINNDMLTIFFVMTAFLYTVRWYKEPTYKNILLLAVSIGCAMSTKLSGSLIAFYTAFVFLLVLVKKWREGAAAPLWGQYFSFAAVCFPLGLWHPVRNYLLFRQPPGYVPYIDESNSLYVGDKLFAARFFAFSFKDLFQNIYRNPFADYRIWEYTVSSSLFGEFTFSEEHRIFAVFLIAANVLLITVSLGAMVYSLRAGRNNRFRFAALSLFALWLLHVFSFVLFNINYPFGCTMDFRYMVPTVITGAAFLGLMYEEISRRKSILSKAVSSAVIVLVALFAVYSVLFYVV